jgi:hypothetical protein
MSAVKSSPDCVTLVGETSLSLSPTPNTPPVETTTCAILPLRASITKSWIFPSSFPSELRRRFPLNLALLIASASPVARFTSSLDIEPARCCDELWDVLEDDALLGVVSPVVAVDPVEVPGEVELEVIPDGSSVRVGSLAAPWLLVVA